MYHWVSATCGKEALPVDGKLTEGLDVAEAIRCLCTGTCSKEAISMNFPVLQIASFDFSCTLLDVCPLIWGPLRAEYISWVDDVRPASGRSLVQVQVQSKAPWFPKGWSLRLVGCHSGGFLIWKKCHSFTDYIHMTYSHVYCKYIYSYTYKYKRYRCIFQGRQGLLVRYVYVL